MPSRPDTAPAEIHWHPRKRRLYLIRVLVVATLVLGATYIGWRWLASANWAAWPIALPLLLAETYSFVDALLFGTTA